MFIRFSKGQFNKAVNRKYKKCVFIGDSVVMEYGNEIVGVARLIEETDKCLDYDVIVAKDCELGGDKIARFIKDMIGKSNKFSSSPSPKRRSYYVEMISGKVLPLKAEIKFSRI